MLQNWLKPVPSTLVELAQNGPAHAFGKNITLFHEDFPDLRQVKIALIGIGEKDANEARHHIYQTVFSFKKMAIADLGNARKSDPSFIINLIYELISGKVLPVIIGADIEKIAAQFLAYQNTKSLVSAALVDEKPRFLLKNKEKTVETILNPLFEPRHPMLFHFSQIGGQAHATPPDVLRFFEKHHFDFFRLGRARTNIEEAEPLIRDADMLAINLAAIKQSEAPGQKNASPSGFTCEEACQLARYAGLSDKLTSFGIFGFQKDLDRDGQTAQVASQLVWYFLDGYFNRKSDYPASTDGLTEYIVDFKDHDWSLTFWKSAKSGRWWLQVPVETAEKHQRHRLIPCSLADYQLACREELPERLLNAFKRFS